MAARVTVEHIVTVLQKEDLDTIAAFDLANLEKIDLCSGVSKAELIEAVQQWNVEIGQAFQVKAWHSRTDGTKGGRHPGDKPFVWVLSGAAGARAAAAVVPAANSSRHEHESASDIERRIRMELTAEFTKKEVLELREEVEQLHDELDELASQPMQAAAAPTPKWWESADGITGVIGKPPGEFVTDLLNGFGILKGKPSPSALNGARAAAASAGAPTAEELALLQAFRVMQAADPGKSEVVKDVLLKDYGPGAKQPPPDDGQA